MEKTDMTNANNAGSHHLLTVYALPRFGASLVLYLQGYVTYFLYTTVFNLAPYLTGISSFVGYLAIGASQFSVGTISDHTNTRWGRRRPYVLFGTPFLLVSFFMLFTPPLFIGSNPGDLILFGWMLIWNSGFEVFYGFVTTPYQSMLPEITAVSERPRASMLQNIFGLLGTAVSVIITFVGITNFTKPIIATKELNVPFVLIFLVSAAICAFFLFYFCWKMPHEEPKYGSRESLVKNLKECIRNRNFLYITIFQGIVSLVPTSALALGYVQNVLHFTTPYFIATAGTLLGVVTLFFLIWRKLIEVRGKKWTLQIILLFGAIIFPLSLIGIMQSDYQIIPTLHGLVFTPAIDLGILFIALLAIYIAGWSLFPYILYADLTEDDARRTDNFKAGAYTGFPSIPLNIFQGISILITGILDSSLPVLIYNTPPTSNVSWYYVVWGPISTAYLVISYLFLRKYVTMDFAWEKKEKGRVTKYEPGMIKEETSDTSPTLADNFESRMQDVSSMVENMEYDAALVALGEIRADASRDNLPDIIERANDRIDTIQMLKEKESQLADRDNS